MKVTMPTARIVTGIPKEIQTKDRDDLSMVASSLVDFPAVDTSSLPPGSLMTTVDNPYTVDIDSDASMEWSNRASAFLLDASFQEPIELWEKEQELAKQLARRQRLGLSSFWTAPNDRAFLWMGYRGNTNLVSHPSSPLSAKEVLLLGGAMDGPRMPGRMAQLRARRHYRVLEQVLEEDEDDDGSGRRAKSATGLDSYEETKDDTDEEEDDPVDEEALKSAVVSFGSEYVAFPAVKEQSAKRPKSTRNVSGRAKSTRRGSNPFQRLLPSANWFSDISSLWMKPSNKNGGNQQNQVRVSLSSEDTETSPVVAEGSAGLETSPGQVSDTSSIDPSLSRETSVVSRSFKIPSNMGKPVRAGRNFSALVACDDDDEDDDVEDIYGHIDPSTTSFCCSSISGGETYEEDDDEFESPQLLRNIRIRHRLQGLTSDAVAACPDVLSSERANKHPLSSLTITRWLIRYVFLGQDVKSGKNKKTNNLPLLGRRVWPSKHQEKQVSFGEDEPVEEEGIRFELRPCDGRDGRPDKNVVSTPSMTLLNGEILEAIQGIMDQQQYSDEIVFTVSGESEMETMNGEEMELYLHDLLARDKRRRGRGKSGSSARHVATSTKRRLLFGRGSAAVSSKTIASDALSENSLASSNRRLRKLKSRLAMGRWNSSRAPSSASSRRSAPMSWML